MDLEVRHSQVCEILAVTTRKLHHTRKITLCIWWTNREAVHYELPPAGQIITADLYSHQLESVQQTLKPKEPALGVLFLRENPKPHVARVARDTIQ